MRVLVLASHYRADHEQALKPYRRMNAVASSWNTALFAELARLDLELHIVQFWPIRGYRRFREDNVTHHYLPKLPWLDSFTSRVKRLRVAAMVRELRPDVVHGIGSEHGYAWAAAGHGVPSVITIHGWLKIINTLPGHASMLRHWFLVREEARALHEADCVLAINEYMRERFVVEGGCPRARTRVIPNALNPIYLQPWTEQPRPIDIIMVGTLHPLKNQDVALDLLARLTHEHGVRPRVVVAGAATADSAPYARRLEGLRGDAGLDNVEFVGRKSTRELFDLYRGSRFLLHLSAFETDSIVVAEALACGTLPVVNPVAALAHRVQDGRNGRYLPIGDRTGAAATLASLLRDEAQRERLATVGRGQVLAQCRPDQVAKATWQAYSELAPRA